MLVWACIAPHGGELIPELANGNLARMAQTREAMAEMGRRCREAEPDTIVVYTPHGIHIQDHVCMSVTVRAEGELHGESGAHVCADFAVDRALAKAIAQRAAQAGVPIAQAAYQQNGRPAPLLPLDWGALIPLWFMGAQWPARPKIVVVCPSRSLEREQLMAFGRATAEAASEVGKRVALICSADQGHGHDAGGPYGFAPQSAEYDRAYCEAVTEEDLPRLLDWHNDWIEYALTDSYWQTLMLHGALEHAGFYGELLSYEAPTYFGMACAAFRPRT